MPRQSGDEGNDTRSKMSGQLSEPDSVQQAYLNCFEIFVRNVSYIVDAFACEVSANQWKIKPSQRDRAKHIRLDPHQLRVVRRWQAGIKSELAMVGTYVARTRRA